VFFEYVELSPPLIFPTILFSPNQQHFVLSLALYP